MDQKKLNVKVLIGLPAVLILAAGIAYGAARLHDSLASEAPSTLTADEAQENTNTVTDEANQNSNPTTNLNSGQPNTNSSESDYVFLRTALEEELARRWTGTAAQYRAAAEANLSAYCQLIDQPDDVALFPVGRIRDEWAPPPNAFEADPADNPVCPYLPDTPSVRIPIRRDQDNDGLPAVAELWYGTSDTTADTDSDGFSDVEEITNGYSPLTPGSS